MKLTKDKAADKAKEAAELEARFNPKYKAPNRKADGAVVRSLSEARATSNAKKQRDLERKQHLRLKTDAGFQYGWEAQPTMNPGLWGLRCNQVVQLLDGDEPIWYFILPCTAVTVFEYTNFVSLYEQDHGRIMKRAKQEAEGKKNPRWYSVELTQPFAPDLLAPVHRAMDEFFKHCERNLARPTVDNKELLLAVTGNNVVGGV